MLVPLGNKPQRQEAWGQTCTWRLNSASSSLLRQQVGRDMADPTARGSGTLLSDWGTEAQDQRGTGSSISYQLAAGTWRQELWVVSLWFSHHQAALPCQFPNMLVSWWYRRRGMEGKN